MAVSERERRELQEALVGTIGPEPTDTLLGYLPPVGWADVATKRDLDALEDRLGVRIDRLDGKIDGVAGTLEAKIQHSANVLLLSMVTLQFATIGVIVGVLTLLQR